MNKNVLRSQRKKSTTFIAVGILLAAVFAVMMYFGYYYLNYVHINGSVNDFEEIMLMIVSMFNLVPSIPFNFVEIFALQFTTFWWVYLLVLLIVFLAVTGRKNDDFKNMEQGSAIWASEATTKRFEKDKSNGVPCGRNFYVPLESDETANLNEMVIGGSGAGKTWRKIKPDLLQLFGSYVVTDPAGELFRDTYRMFIANNYKVKVLNLTDIRYSNSYNPFAYVHSEQDVLEMATLFMKNSAGKGEKEDFFTGSALELLTCISLYLFHMPDEIKSFGRVIRLVNSISYVGGKMSPQCELARCMSNYASMCKDPNASALVSFRGMQDLPQETMGSIAKTLSTRLQLWSLSEVDSFMDKDEMEFDKIGFEKTVIFLIIPAAKKTYRVIANLFYSQLFNELMRVAEAQPSGRLKHLVSLEIDEFANIGEIPDFPETLAVIRKYNIRACIVLQGLSQLKAIYKDNWESIIGNCDIFTFLGSKDQDTKEYISKKLGNTTVRVDTRSYNRGGSAQSSGGGQDSENYVSRPLLYPDEIPKAIKSRGKSKRKYGGKCFVWVGMNDPFYLDKFDTKSHLRISDCGSKYDTRLCSDITKVYADIYDQRKQAYLDKQAKRADELESLFDDAEPTEEPEPVMEEIEAPDEEIEEYDDRLEDDDIAVNAEFMSLGGYDESEIEGGEDNGE